MHPSSPTSGVRSWRRSGPSTAASAAERVTETTRPDDMLAALAEADFATIPRQSPEHAGYDEAYADAFAAALHARFGYAGGRRVSASGRSHVFERLALPSGATVDLGVALPASAHPGSALPSRAPRGDGALRGVPALAARQPHP